MSLLDCMGELRSFCVPAGTLWLGNAAMMHLSVSFIQMLKALMPVAVFGTGCMFGLETYSTPALTNMVPFCHWSGNVMRPGPHIYSHTDNPCAHDVQVVITAGVAIASYGEINFVIIGVAMQLVSVATESVRLSLVQILLQRRGLSLNPITSLLYIAPASFAFLSIPWWFIEAGPLLGGDKVPPLAPLQPCTTRMGHACLPLHCHVLVGTHAGQ